MANEVLTVENCSYEQLIGSKPIKLLQQELNLSKEQIAKGNMALMNLINDEKLQGCSNMSKARFVYSVALLNYKHPNAIAPVKYGTNVMAQPQYQSFIEDMTESGAVLEANATPIYKGIDYKAKVNVWGYKELVVNEIKLDDPFQALEVIGYYAYAKCKDGKIITCLMSVDDIAKWAERYSISQRKFKKGEAKSSIWNDNVEKMALKTVIKAVGREVAKWYPYDRLNKLIALDQAVFTEKGVSYADNPQKEEVEGKPLESINNTLEKPQD